MYKFGYGTGPNNRKVGFSNEKVPFQRLYFLLEFSLRKYEFINVVVLSLQTFYYLKEKNEWNRQNRSHPLSGRYKFT